ncbi:sugar porter family MFS transporter [Peribacillus psychrosaccharolyticus]|uniref:Sugar porter family MFS transporter n=1 Tax=Peribacillus psychrosaccharolyticus TaxID=1407 RepID=A0A974S1W6_PERPY|nr:sugar porter family MFS transporter [Peribacillus psychrosaccharolyticus]MEC2055118.1 sugar porter family MFS transporter [Peribacillus psychrosaccharolyticus]MED3743830.1 sugar porter family MFS transporter [Peribacillus psychrosaccharolyticus]QQT01974.1 sugar porter family MFS transporter [Peribacillus psychrosaccharolyticus]
MGTSKLRNTHSFWYIVIISAAAGMAGLLYGYDTAVISGAIGFLQELYDLSPAMEGFVISSIMIGGIIGVAVSGYLSDAYGRKKILMVAAILFAISAIGSALAISVAMLIGARIIGGIGIGLASALAVTYITECAPAAIRGRLSSMYQLFTVIGISATFFVNLLVADSGTHEWGVETGWRWMLGYGVIPALIFYLTLLFVPESPRYLVQKGRDQEALQVLTNINGSEAAKVEMKAIKHSIDTETNLSMRQLFKPGLRKALGVGIFLALFNQVIGMNAITYYGPEIFRMVGFEDNTEFVATSMVGLMQVVATVAAVILIDKAGRKKLMAIGSFFMALFMLLIGGVFFFDINSGPLLVIFIMGFTAAFCISMGPIPWIMIPEIFPNHLRARAVGLTTMFLWGANWAIGQFTPMLLNGLGGAITFWIFAAINVICFIFVMTIIPETKNKTLEEIEQFWKPKNQKVQVRKGA